MVCTRTVRAVVLHRLTARRLAVLDGVAARVPYGDGVRVAVDGVDGAGKTVFADQLADVLRAKGREVVRVSADGFHHVRAVRWQRGRDSAEGFLRSSYDLVALRERVLDPLGPGGDRLYRTASHDLATDERIDPPARRRTRSSSWTGSSCTGIFLQRDELVGCWELSVFLRVSFAVSVARMAARDGGSPDPDHPSAARYVDGQRLYLAACSPPDRADLVVDHDDLDAPVLRTGGSQRAAGSAPSPGS